MWFPNRSDTNWPIQAQKRARSLKYQIKVEEELYYPSSENKSADQLCGYREADLGLCFHLCMLLVWWLIWLPPKGEKIEIKTPVTYHNQHMVLGRERGWVVLKR